MLIVTSRSLLDNQSRCNGSQLRSPTHIHMQWLRKSCLNSLLDSCLFNRIYFSELIKQQNSDPFLTATLYPTWNEVFCIKFLIQSFLFQNLTYYMKREAAQGNNVPCSVSIFLKISTSAVVLRNFHFLEVNMKKGCLRRGQASLL